MSDVLWNGREIRDPWSSFELTWHPAGCRNDKGKVISWGKERPLDKFLFPPLKKYHCLLASQVQTIVQTVLPCSDDGFYYWPEWQQGAVSCLQSVAKGWKTGTTQHGNIQTVMTVSAFFIATERKDIRKGRVCKKIRLWDSGSVWMLIGQMLLLIVSLMDSRVVHIQQVGDRWLIFNFIFIFQNYCLNFKYWDKRVSKTKHQGIILDSIIQTYSPMFGCNLHPCFHKLFFLAKYKIL